MNSVAEALRSELEATGEYVVRANADSGWFAVFPQTWQERTTHAVRQGRDGPNLVVYRTKSGNARDHFVIPHSILRELLVDSTLTHSDVNGTSRWNFTLKNGLLHVTHSDASIDVSKFHGQALVVEKSKDWASPDEIPELIQYREGLSQQVVVNRDERDPRARGACIEHYGARCQICNMDFAAIYGPLMAGYIHVHHLTPLASVGTDYVVDSIADLRPVCPNCHSVIHRREPPYSLDEVRSLMKSNMVGNAPPTKEGGVADGAGAMIEDDVLGAEVRAAGGVLAVAL